MQLALRLCFCLMPIASISTTSQKFRNAVVVSHVKIHPNRRSGDTTTPHRRMEPERRFPPPPSVQDANRGRGGAVLLDHFTRVPAGSFSSSEAVSLASSENRSELKASESESEVPASSTWLFAPQSCGKSCDLKHLVHLAYR